MPLSEEELRLLEQMEQALAQEDPKFASTLRGSQMERTAKVRTMGAAAAFALGIAMFLGGAVTQQIWLAIVGFLVMVPSATFALATWHNRAAHAGVAQQPSPEQQVERAMGLDDPPHRFGVVEGGRSAKRRPRSGRSSAKPPKAPRRARGQGGQGGSFMQRMEQRWERRRRQGYEP